MSVDTTQTPPSQIPPVQAAQPVQPIQPVHDELTFNTTPNWLTLIRMGFVPIVVGLAFARTPTMDLMAALAFVVASITDYFDGYLARTRKVVTVYGKLLDPLADKFLVVSALIMLQELGRIHPVVVILLICRELAITGLRALASAEGVIIDASSGGKWKTGTQMVAIPLLLACDQNRRLLGLPLYPLGMILLYISLAISLWSAKSYIVDFFRAIKEQRKQRQKERKLARAARRAAREARLAAKAQRPQSP
jgi:CDP-diacylglycerol--glycerol-3-phosphate 3-phosphatidyltransferase